MEICLEFIPAAEWDSLEVHRLWKQLLCGAMKLGVTSQQSSSLYQEALLLSLYDNMHGNSSQRKPTTVVQISLMSECSVSLVH
jgi:hypothetical protein